MSARISDLMDQLENRRRKTAKDILRHNIAMHDVVACSRVAFRRIGIPTLGQDDRAERDGLFVVTSNPLEDILAWKEEAKEALTTLPPDGRPPEWTRESFAAFIVNAAGKLRNRHIVPTPEMMYREMCLQKSTVQDNIRRFDLRDLWREHVVFSRRRPKRD